VQFGRNQMDRKPQLEKLGGVTGVESRGSGEYRLMTSNGSLTTTQLVEMATAASDPIRGLSVQNTTLDDVFVYYTGRQLRDEQVKPLSFVMPPRPGMQP